MASRPIGCIQTSVKEATAILTDLKLQRDWKKQRFFPTCNLSLPLPLSSPAEEDVSDWLRQGAPGYRWTTDTEDMAADVASTDRAAWDGDVAKARTPTPLTLP